MNDGGNSHRHPFHALPVKPVSVKREAEEGEGPASAVLPSATTSMAAAGGNSHRHLFYPLPTKPVSVKREAEEGEGPASTVLPSSTTSMAAAGAEDHPPIDDGGEQEEALTALVEFRSKEVERLRLRLEYYKSQVEDAERKLNDSRAKLALLRSDSDASSLRLPLEAKGSAKPPAVNGGIYVKEEETSPARGSEQQLRPQPPVAAPPPEQQRRQQQPQLQSRPPLIIPSVRPKPVIPSSTDAKVMGRAGRLEATVPATSASASVVASSPGVLGSRASPSYSSQSGEAVNRLKRVVPSTPSPDKCRVIKNSKMKFVHREHTDLVSSVRRSSSPSTIRFQPGVHISSEHKRKLRCLEINPVQDQLFVTSALDGVVNLWQLQTKGSGASVLSTTDCLSPKQRRWPEDIAWHPDGDRLFIVYSADSGDSQIAMLNLNSSSKRVTFLPEVPHIKGIINSIQFMPMADLCFATGGSDHAVILWHEGDSENEWKPKAVHRNLHSAAVMGVAGLQQKKVVLSVGVDKRIIGFDLAADKAEFMHQIETKCLSVLPNPSDFNLFMVQSGTPQKQLRLFDIRLRRTELHSFGWKQERSESQSALINQAWSPDGLFISSGSADPMIHIFDIRYNSHNPSQSVQAHQKRVFKAAWHQSLPLLISISSDLNLGIHKTI